MKIFIVDDDPVARMIVADQLRNVSCELREFDSGTALLAAMGDAPDLILLDIEMPGINGIAACQMLRRDGFRDAQVIFVSGHDDLDLRLEAYAAGGSDFIVKPYYAEELQEKVRVAERNLAERQEIASQARYATTTAMTAMSAMGELGSVIAFMRASFATADQGQLAERMIETLRTYDITALLRLRSAHETTFHSTKGACSQLETSILEHSADLGHQFEFHNRLAINYAGLTLLVIDLPSDQPERVGRLRDNLALLAEGAAARLSALDDARLLSRQAAGIQRALEALTAALGDIDAKKAQSRLQLEEAYAGFLDELSHKLVQLGLSDAQEIALVGLAERFHAKVNAIHDGERDLDGRLRQVHDRLGSLASRPERGAA